MAQIRLDLKDRKILYQLDLNARQSNSKIAKKVGLSKDVVNYRIKRLEKSGLIQGYYTIIDFSRLGYFSMRVYLRFFDTTPKKEKEIIDFLINNKRVFYLAGVDGNFDINFGVRVKDIYEFDDFYSDFKRKFKEYVGEEQISIFTKVHHFHRAYLLNKNSDSEKQESFGKEKIVPHDETDLKILKMIAKDARIQVIAISQKLKIPPRTVAFRIKQLEKKKIIQGYRLIFNFGLFGYQYYKVDLILKDTRRFKELINYVRMNPNVLYVDETIGGSDFEFDAEVESKEKFYEMIEALRTKFSEIRRWDYLTIKKYYKLIYF